MSLIKRVVFPKLGDERGNLIVLEQEKTVPFQIKRLYYIYGTSAGVSRGFHAHRKLEQLAVCVAGKCRMLLDDGINQQDVWLDTPQEGILIESMIWHEMHDFSSDCVLLVIASEHYDESDYIREYSKFKEVTSNANDSPTC